MTSPVDESTAAYLVTREYVFDAEDQGLPKELPPVNFRDADDDALYPTLGTARRLAFNRDTTKAGFRTFTRWAKTQKSSKSVKIAQR